MNLNSYIELQKRMTNMHLALESPFLETVRQIEKTSALFLQKNSFAGLSISQDLVASAYRAIDLQQNALSKIDKSWLNKVLPAMDLAANLNKSVLAMMNKQSVLNDIAGRFRSQTDFAGLHTALRVKDNYVSQIQKQYEAMEGSFALLNSTFLEPIKLAQLPTIVMPGASREVLVAEYSLAELSSHDNQIEKIEYDEVITDIREETSEAIILLKQVNPELANAYQGAKDAFENKNADWERHVLTSLREMWSHLLRHLAPEDKLTAWIGGNDDYLHKGKPNRKAKYEYICRDINHKPLAKFLSCDTKTFLEMFNLFNRIHEIGGSLTEPQFKAILLRTDSWLMFILNISS